MAATQLTIQTGLTINPTPNAANVDGNFVIPTGLQRLALRVTNGGGSSVNVILDDVNSSSPESATAWNPDVTLAVTNGQSRYFVISDVSRFRDAATGKISWTYSAVASVTVEVIGL